MIMFPRRCDDNSLHKDIEHSYNLQKMKLDPHWALYPKSYTVYPAPPGLSLIDQIDGDLTKEVWSHAAPWSAPFEDIQGADGPSTPKPALTQFRALYDDFYLYIGALIPPSPDVPATEAHFVHRNDPIFQKDSDFEVFIDTTGCNHQYKEFEINAINTAWNLLLDKPYTDGGREHSGRVAKPGEMDYYDVKYQKTAVRILEGSVNDPKNGQALWSVEMAFAYKDLFVTVPEGMSPNSQTVSPSAPPKPGDFWRVNFSRVEKKGAINWVLQPQIVWNPSSHKFTGIIDMHAPDSWGYFHFVGEDNHQRSFQQVDRDATWPLRLTAMHIYYAQRGFFHNEQRFASSMKELEAYVDLKIVGPFDIHLFVKNQEYMALVRSNDDSMIATVSHDRLLSIHEWDNAVLQQMELYNNV
jgi:hypothetical protein